MKNKYLIAVLSMIVLLGLSYWYWQSKKTETEIIPSVSTNPLDNKPNVNPIDQTNPFNNIKTNPFE